MIDKNKIVFLYIKKEWKDWHTSLEAARHLTATATSFDSRNNGIAASACRDNGNRNKGDVSIIDIEGGVSWAIDYKQLRKKKFEIVYKRRGVGEIARNKCSLSILFVFVFVCF